MVTFAITDYKVMWVRVCVRRFSLKEGGGEGEKGRWWYRPYLKNAIMYCNNDNSARVLTNFGSYIKICYKQKLSRILALSLFGASLSHFTILKTVLSICRST